MPKFALANGLWLGRLPPLPSWRDSSITAEHPLLGHRMLMSLARVVMTHVVMRKSNSERKSWQDAYHQKGLRGNVIMFPNASHPKVDEFPQADLNDSFIAVFVGVKKEDFTKATFARVDKEAFKKEAKFIMKTNPVYNKARFRPDLVDESMLEDCFVYHDEPEADAKDENDTPEDEVHVGDMRQTGPSAAVEGDAAEEDGDDKCAPWTSVLPDVGLEDLPMGGALAVCQEKFEQMEKAVARTKIAEKKAEIEQGIGPEDEAGRLEILKLCDEAQKAIKKSNLHDDTVDIEEAVRRAEGVRPKKGHVTEPRLVVPSAGKPLSFFDPEFWTRGAPYEWVYGDCSWGHESMDVTHTITDFIRCLWYREELEYTTPSDEKTYVAPTVNRFRHPNIVHILASVWRTSQTLTAVNAWVRQKGMFKLLASITKMSPELMRNAMMAGQVAGSFRSVMTNAAVP